MALAAIVTAFLLGFCLFGVPMGFGFVVRPRLTIALSITALVVLGLGLAFQMQTGQVTFNEAQSLASGLGGFTGSFAGQLLGLMYERDPR